MVDRKRVELSLKACKALVLPLHYQPMKELIMKDSAGSRRLHARLECGHCGKEFWKPKKNLRYNASYCSRQCVSDANSARAAVKLECASCGEAFLRAFCKMKNSKHGVYFCSRKCKDVGQRLSNNIPAIRPPHYGEGKNYRVLALP